MRHSKILIIGLMLTALLINAGVVNAASVTDNFDNFNAWTLGQNGGTITNVGGQAYFVQTGTSSYPYIIRTNPITGFSSYYKYTVYFTPEVWGTTTDTQAIIGANYFNGANDISTHNFYIRGDGSVGLYTGGFTYSAAGVAPLSAGTTYKMSLEYKNNRLIGSVDDVEKINVSYTAPVSDRIKPTILLAGWSSYHPKGYYDNFYFTTDGISLTDFNGYCSDDNGNPLQYCNIQLWNTSAQSQINPSTITDAAGYYSFNDIVITLGTSYNMRVLPPNMGITNYYNFTINSPTETVTHNFTVSPITAILSVYDGDDPYHDYIDDMSLAITKGGVTKYYLNKTSAWTYPEPLNMADTLDITINASGYVETTTSYTVDRAFNVVQIPMSRDNTAAGHVLIMGHTRDNTGTIITGLDAWLINSDNETVDHTISAPTGTNPGYYSLRVPTNVQDDYTVTVYFPGYGNLTADLRDAGSQADIGASDVISYSDTWTDEGLNGASNMGVDLWFSQAGTYTPSATPTPPSGGSTPVTPSGYSLIYGQTYDIATGSNVPSMSLKLYYENGTQLSTATTDTSAGYSFTIPDSTPAQIFRVHADGSTQYEAVDTYVSYPYAVGKTYRNDIGLHAKADFDQYEWIGYLYDAAENTRLTYGNVTVYGPGDVQVGVYPADQGGNYHVYLNTFLTPGTYILSGQATGYVTQNVTFYIPETFVQFKQRTLNIAMVPENFNNDYNNGIYLEVNDADTGIRLIHANYELSYDNGTYFTSGSMNGKYNVFIGDLPPGAYYLKATYNGYTPATTYVTIAEDQLVDVNISLYGIVAPTALPTVTPSATPTPTNRNVFNIVDSLIDLWKLLGLDDGSARIMCGFMLIVIGIIVGAIAVKKIAGLESAGNLVIAIGGGAGFTTACLVKDSAGVTLWPMFLLLVAGFAVVIWLVYTFTQGRAGGA